MDITADQIIEMLNQSNTVQSFKIEDVDDEGIEEQYHFDDTCLWYVEDNGEFKTVRNYPYNATTYNTLQGISDFEFVKHTTGSFPNAQQILENMKLRCL